MGLSRKARDEAELAQNAPTEAKSGFEGNLHLALPMVEDWRIEYYIDHESANFSVDLDATFDSVWFLSKEVDGKQLDMPSYLRDWEDKYCQLMINSYPTAEDFELRQTAGQLGFGWRGQDNRFIIKVYLTRTEFRDVVDVLRQDHLRHTKTSRDVILGWLQQHGVDRTEEFEKSFAPSENPKIRIDVKNTRLADQESIVKAEVWFDVCRIYA